MILKKVGTSMKIPDEVKNYWGLFGYNEKDLLEMEKEGIVSFKTKEELLKECDDLIQKLSQQ